jgi:hypothetical protein
MSHDDVLLGYRLQLFDLAGRAGVTEACRTFGVHRSSEARRRVARELAQAGWPLERVLCDKGNEFRGEPFRQTIAGLAASSDRRAGRCGAHSVHLGIVCHTVELSTAAMVKTATDGSLDIRPDDPLRCPATQDTRRTSSDAPSDLSSELTTSTSER